jgi:glycosyltransferase involved in cell wall biosynthesis
MNGILEKPKIQKKNSKSIKEPIISVIITSYNRNEYLAEAIESVYNQTLEHCLFEILIITNIKDHDLEKRFNINTKFIYMPDGPVSEYIIEGIKNAKGNIVSFLDDDDLFIPNKLEIVLQKFLGYPDLIYLHNNFFYLHSSQTVTMKSNKRIKKDIIIYTPNIKKLDLKKIYKVINKSYAINLSSVSVKREVLLSNIERLKYMLGATDYFILYICLSIDASKLMFLKDTFTAYRISNSSTHVTRGNMLDIDNFHKLCDYQLYSFEYLLKFNKKTPYSFVILSSIYQWKLLLSIIEPKHETKKILSQAKDYIETTYRFTYMKKYVIIFLIISKILLPRKTTIWFLHLRSVFYI